MERPKNFEELARTLRGQRDRIPSDVEGSYTGTYNDPEDPQPVQDVDDL
ncbi:MAG: hypothetical protein IJN08_04660 [Clostridia bacterium]|nr:hypothetical protein [Clostridia bacterium]